MTLTYREVKEAATAEALCIIRSLVGEMNQGADPETIETIVSGVRDGARTHRAAWQKGVQGAQPQVLAMTRLRSALRAFADAWDGVGLDVEARRYLGELERFRMELPYRTALLADFDKPRFLGGDRWATFRELAALSILAGELPGVDGSAKITAAGIVQREIRAIKMASKEMLRAVPGEPRKQGSRADWYLVNPPAKRGSHNRQS